VLSEIKERTSGAKAQGFIRATARLKPCPFNRIPSCVSAEAVPFQIVFYVSAEACLFKSHS
jgi:hypothetical protein